jgi:hypothetical protein
MKLKIEEKENIKQIKKISEKKDILVRRVY